MFYRRTAVAALAAVVVLAMGPVVGAQGGPAPSPHTPVSSDGSVGTAPKEAVTPFSASSPGRPAAEDPSAAATGGVESIIGPDGRVRVNPTTTYPADATAFITFGTGRTCTGWFINADTVATAGSCVHSGGSGGSWYPESSYKVYPGRNGTSSPYGYCTARTLYSVVGWVSSKTSNYDYGAIKLNCTIGNTVGWYGYFWTDSSLTGLAATIQGYPRDKTYGTQWKMSGPITWSGTYRVRYTIDTSNGQIGSPVWYNFSPSCNPCSMAIHTSNGTTYNSGVRITQLVFNNLTSWKYAT